MGDYPQQLRSLPAQQRQPPYSMEAEQCVLGGLLLDNRSWSDIADRLGEQDFYRADHQLIWRAICELIGANRPCDFVTLTEHLRARNQVDEAGGLSYLGSLANDTPSCANVGAYADLVRERSVMRQIVAAGGDIAELGYRPDGREADELIVEAQKLVMGLATGKTSDGDPVLIGACVREWQDDYFARKSAETPPGLQTGFGNVDQMIIGLEPGDLMIAAGATGMGKTVFGLTIAEHVASHVGPVAGYSFEMPRKQWLTRLVASRGRIPLHRLRDPRQSDVFFDDDVMRALGEVNKLPFYVSDRAGQSIQQVRSRTMRLQDKLKGALKLVLLDYVQLTVGDRRNGDSRATEIDSVGRGLKALAKDAGLAVLALAQINDDPNKRDNKRPRLSDMRESKGITQDADIVALLYRDEYFNRNSPHAGIVEVDIAKQRNGKLDVAELQWLGGFCLMADYFGPTARERAAAAEPAKPPKAPKKTGLAGMLNGASQ